MTTPGGAGTSCQSHLQHPRARPSGLSHRVGAPTSGPSLCPGPMPQGVSYVQISVVYIRNIMPIRAPVGLSRVQSKPLPGRARTPHPPARPDLFSPNDVEEEFCALRPYGILRSSSIQHSRQSDPHATLLSLRSVLHPQLSLDLRSSRR